MKIKMLLFVLFTISLYNCSNKFHLKKNYILRQDSKRILRLSFPNDSICVVKNTYHIRHGKSEQISYQCKYVILSKNYLLLVNNGELVDSIGKGIFIFPQQYLDTPKFTAPTGPDYSPIGYKYLTVPYVGNDSLMIAKGRIGWIKRSKDRKVVGYYEFK